MYSFIGKALFFTIIFSVLISISALLVSRISLKRNVWLAGFFSNVLDFFYLPIKYFFCKFSDPRILDKWIVSLKNIAHDIIEWEVTGVRGVFKDQMIEMHKDHNISSLVSRAVFDNFLLKKAKETGIEVHTGEKVLSCTEKPEFVEVITKEQTYQAKFAIVAEGAHAGSKSWS